jgi:hypothetical protein
LNWQFLYCKYGFLHVLGFLKRILKGENQVL